MNPARELLENCCKDNRKAHHELYVMCFPVLWSVCSRYHSNKEDRMSALNMIFLRLIKGMKTYLDSKSAIPFEQWMRRISINYIIDEFRKAKRYRELVSYYEDSPVEVGLQEEVESAFEKEELMHAIDQLPAASRTVFNLYAIDGYKHDEIAALLGISSGTSKSHLFKARKKLQELLSEIKKKRSEVII